jgi:hypothetical protein
LSPQNVGNVTVIPWSKGLCCFEHSEHSKISIFSSTTVSIQFTHHSYKVQWPSGPVSQRGLKFNEQAKFCRNFLQFQLEIWLKKTRKKQIFCQTKTKDLQRKMASLLR